MTSAPMTPRQRDTYEFIGAFVDQYGHSPSYDEIAKGIGVRSKSSVHRLVTGLAERGAIRHYTARSRGVSIISNDPRNILLRRVVNWFENERFLWKDDALVSDIRAHFGLPPKPPVTP